MNQLNQTTKRRVHTVSQLTAIVKNVLEDALPFVWVTGEISNLRIPTSGHYYFTLKDENAQIRSVMFKGHARNLQFMPCDGEKILCLGRLAVYEPQGAYQVLIEHMEPAGMGALALAFEQLKAKLSEEGLFDEAHKKEFPFIPQEIAVITSPTGAVIHDILRVLEYRFSKVHVQVWPVRVQGSDSASQVSKALFLVNQQDKADIIIVARGGGSLEDLAAFNSEDVARAIFSSEIPVISAVGHETDYTIADFVADKRAPTPSAAAEMAVPEYEGLDYWTKELFTRLKKSLDLTVRLNRDHLNNLKNSLPPPRRQIDDWRLRLDDYNHRTAYLLQRHVQDCRTRLEGSNYKLNSLSPLKIVPKHKAVIELKYGLLSGLVRQLIAKNKSQLTQAYTGLEALNPTAILERGYSITRKMPEMDIIRHSSQLVPGDRLEITLSSGKAISQVVTTEEGKKQ